MKIALTILDVLVSLGLIAVVLLQPGRSAGVAGIIEGGADALFGKKKGLDEKLAKATTGFAIAFLVLTLLLCLF